MSVQVTPGVWWFWLTAITSIVVCCYEVDTEDSERHMIALFMKLAIIVCMTVLYWVISQTLCQRSQSLNTLKLIPIQIEKRDPSLIYGILKPNESFKWINNPHSKYIEHTCGAYTVLRTVEKYNLFQFNMHLKRLLTTTHQYKDNNIKNIEIPSNMLRRLLIRNIREGLDEFYDDYIVKAEETRIMIYIDLIELFKLINNTNANNKIKHDIIEQYLSQCMLIHFETLPNLKRPISVCIRIGRHKFDNKFNKTTQWANEREKFHKDIDKQLSLNEIIMMDVNDMENDGFIMEGLSSNFAVLLNENKLLTPSINDGILGGTVRDFVVDLYKELKEKNGFEDVEKEYGIIPTDIEFGKPLFSDILKWDGMVIMSTSRLLVPIDTVYIDIEDHMLMKLVGNDKTHAIFEVERSNDAKCGYRKIVYERNAQSDILENLRHFIKCHMKSHSLYVGSVFNR